MSHTILIDESNGNGLFAVKTTTSSAAHAVLATSVSNEDLSQSLSEYTDADESMSAPTEFLAEFLSAVMLKDYKKALKYCKLILHYEPNNVTAKEFYPLIQEKLKFDSSSESDENYNKSSSPEVEIDHIEPGARDDQGEGAAESDNSSSIGGGDNLSSSDSVGADGIGTGGGASDNSSNGGGTSDSEDADASTSESDENNLEVSNSNASTSSTSRSDNTTHSYSSLLLEEDDEQPPAPDPKGACTPNLDFSNGNLKSTSCSDSESPTEPLTQRLVAILRSKCVPGKATSTKGTSA